MSKVYLEDSTLTAIGNAIRGKTGESGLLLPSEMADAIASIESGGSGGDFDLSNIKYYVYNSSKVESSYIMPNDFSENSTILLWASSKWDGTTNKGVLGGLCMASMFFDVYPTVQQRGGFYTKEYKSPIKVSNLLVTVGYGITDATAAGMLNPTFFMRNVIDYDSTNNKVIKVQANTGPNTRGEYTGAGGFRMLYIP